jgi:hypothetical protein
VKQALRRIGIGLLYGIGFGVSFWTLYVPAYLVMERAMYSPYREGRVEDVAVLSHEKAERGPAIVVLGSLENRGRRSVSGLTVVVDLYDAADRFVEQCREHVSGAIPAGAKRNFQVTCGREERPVAQHARYDIAIMEF